MATTTTQWTFEDFERLPDQPGKRELVKGELIELPPAEFKHNTTAHRIFLLLHAALTEAHKGGEAQALGGVYHEMGYHLGDGWLQPDVSVTHPGQTAGKYLEGAPAIAIEVVSPGNTAEQMELKAGLYFQYGAREVWRVYPKSRHVVVQIGARAEVITENVTTPLLPDFRLSVAGILSEE